MCFNELVVSSEKYRYAEKLALIEIKHGNLLDGEERRGQYQEALERYEALVNDQPDNHEYAQMLDHLKEILDDPRMSL